MSSPHARISRHSGYYHVTCTAPGAWPLFVDAADFLAFLEILGDGFGRHGAPLIAYCLMARQWHLLAGPVGNIRLTRALRWVATTHSTAWRRVHGIPTGTGTTHTVLSCTEVDDLAAIVPLTRYVERYPKSAGLVSEAERWPWSSLHQRLSGHTLVPIAATSFLSSRLWLDYVNSAQTLREQIGDARSKHAPPHRAATSTGWLIGA